LQRFIESAEGVANSHRSMMCAFVFFNKTAPFCLRDVMISTFPACMLKAERFLAREGDVFNVAIVWINM
jgi:hypothetical protein